jgi:hypothetical protein
MSRLKGGVAGIHAVMEHLDRLLTLLHRTVLVVFAGGLDIVPEWFARMQADIVRGFRRLETTPEILEAKVEA